MSKKRVHELAKELGIDNKEIIARMEKLGIAVRSHSSTLEEADVERITRELRTKAPAEMVEKRIKSTVIRRRSVRAVSEEAADTDEATIEAVEPPPASTLPAQEPLDKPVVPKKKILDKSSALPKESREISPPPGEEAPEKSPVTAKVPPAPVVEPTLVAPPAAADEKVAKTESKAGVPEPLEKTLPEPTPLEPSIPPEQTVEQVSAQVRVEKTVEEKPAPEKTREQPAFKPEVPVRKPGVPFRAEGRKPLPEERRKLEGPKLVIPPKAAAAPETPAEVKATPEISAAPGEPPGKAEVKAAPAQPVPPPSRPQTPAPTGKKIERPEPKQTPARISGPPAPGTKRPARPAAPSPPVLTPPPLEKVWKEEPVRFKGKIKKQQEALLTEKPPIKKKLVAAKLPDLTDDFDDIDLPEKPLKWREERKSPVAKAMKKTAITTPKAIKRRVKVAEAITVGELAKKMGVKASEVISKLMSLGLMVSINQPIDRDTATIVAADFGFQIEAVVDEYDDLLTQKAEVTSSNLKPRAPVVTIMGHVDHGKTSLLDAIRMTNVIDGEAGGITQAIGAYHVEIKGREIVFLDTPGHEAFTAMRARGAQVTDIVVLVVAADDGVKEQTIEAINHARVAGVPIIVAVNKIDKPGADPGKIKQSLTEYNLLAEEWGGDTIFCEVSAKKKMGIEDLLEMILLQAEIMDLKADPDRPARGVIIEAKLDRGRGPVSTVLIQEGTLREGDAFVSKTEFGRVRAMYNDQGNRVKEAGPSMPVEVIGFSGVPPVGSEFIVMEDEKKARAISEAMVRKEREKDLLSSAKITLEQLYEKIREGIKDFNVIIKGDVQGSVEALSESLRKLSDADVKLKIIHASTGAITETDVMLASASNAIIIGFNVRPDGRVAELAQQEGIEIKLYDIIYNAIADVKAAMEGSLKPVYKEVVHGRAEIRNTFRVSKVGTIAGCYVDEGKIARSYRVKLIRDGVVVYSGKIQSLKRFKDDVKEVLAGFECGLAIEGFNDLKVGDVIEAYSEEQVERSSRD